MKYTILPLAALLAIIITPLCAEEPTAPAAVANASAKWEKEIAAFEASDKASPPPQHAVLFIGASGIRMWTTLAADFPQHQIINRGFGGSMVADSVAFVDRIVLPYHPAVILLQAGGNDINGGKTPETVFADTKAFVTKVRASLPEARIIFMGQGPSEARWNQAADQQKLNSLVKAFAAQGKNLDFIDMWDAFLGPDGKPNPALFIADKLHHNAEGYKIRVKLTTPHLPVVAVPETKR
jgi:lysophospholipase L1-like esterase